MKGLSPKQQIVLGFIVGYTEKYLLFPSLREIGRAMSIISTNGVSDHLRALVRKGYLLKIENGYRLSKKARKEYELVFLREITRGKNE